MVIVCRYKWFVTMPAVEQRLEERSTNQTHDTCNTKRRGRAEMAGSAALCRGAASRSAGCRARVRSSCSGSRRRRSGGSSTRTTGRGSRGRSVEAGRIGSTSDRDNVGVCGCPSAVLQGDGATQRSEQEPTTITKMFLQAGTRSKIDSPGVSSAALLRELFNLE